MAYAGEDVLPPARGPRIWMKCVDPERRYVDGKKEKLCAFITLSILVLPIRD